MDKKKCTIVIPARIGSTRLPNKPLINLAGKPLLSWVIESALKVNFACEIVVVTDDKRIQKLSEDLGVKSIITHHDHQNGTERILEILNFINSEFVINLQGDEPLVNPIDLNLLFKEIQINNFDVASLCHEMTPLEARNSSNVKVVFDKNLRALYFSRSKIPYNADSFYCHMGIYAFKKSALVKIKNLQPSFLEQIENLEQLRWLENNISIGMFVTKNKSIGVDNLDDLIKAENAILANNIKGLICDIDGTLTNGIIWYGKKGEELKSFNVKDGSAIKRLILKGFKIGFISGRDSSPLRIRAKELGVEFIKFNQNDKKKGSLELINQMKLKPLEVAYIGDDKNDIGCCSVMPFSFAVNDSHKEFIASSRFYLESKGGEGVISEFIEKINSLATNKKI